jgi:L-cystine transport system permease protein
LKVFIPNINDWSPIIFAIAAFALHSAAFLSEVMRSAYLAVGKGQQEAAYSVGMNSFQAFRRIILPQAFGIALPNLGNNLIILLKETSLAFSIGITDIMGRVTIIMGNNFGANQFQIYTIISLMYWGICVLLETGTHYLENTYKRGHIGIAG